FKIWRITSSLVLSGTLLSASSRSRTAPQSDGVFWRVKAAESALFPASSTRARGEAAVQGCQSAPAPSGVPVRMKERKAAVNRSDRAAKPGLLRETKPDRLFSPDSR